MSNTTNWTDLCRLGQLKGREGEMFIPVLIVGVGLITPERLEFIEKRYDVKYNFDLDVIPREHIKYAFIVLSQKMLYTVTEKNLERYITL